MVGGSSRVMAGVTLPVFRQLGRLSRSGVAARMLLCADPYCPNSGAGNIMSPCGREQNWSLRRGFGGSWVGARRFSGEISGQEYESVCEETLESLCEFFEELVESTTLFRGSDVAYQDGVLTVNLGPEHGVYVINRQSPNKQIWLSSPRSGPKRYDFRADSGSWVYRHDGVSLHDLLEEEFSQMLGRRIDFTKCTHCGRVKQN